MDLYVSTACLSTNKSYSDTVEYYMANGITNIELGSSFNHFATDNESVLHDLQCRFLVHNYFPPSPRPFALNLASNDPEIRQKSLTLVKEAINLSANLKAPFYSVHAGFVTDPYAYGETSYLFRSPIDEDEKESAFRRFVSSMDDVIQFARSKNLKILVENNVCSKQTLDNVLMVTADDFLCFFDTISSDNVGILLDFGHLNVSARTLAFDRLEFITRLSNHIAAFHLHDNNGETDDHKPIHRNSWIIDVICQPVFSSLPIIIEAHFDTIENLLDHRAFLAGIHQIGGGFNGDQ